LLLNVLCALGTHVLKISRFGERFRDGQ